MKRLLIPWIVGGVFVAFSVPASAAGADTSVFDNNPECMERDSAGNPKCVAPSDQTGRRRIYYGPNIPPALKGTDAGATPAGVASPNGNTTNGGAMAPSKSATQSR